GNSAAYSFKLIFISLIGRNAFRKAQTVGRWDYRLELALYRSMSEYSSVEFASGFSCPQRVQLWWQPSRQHWSRLCLLVLTSERPIPLLVPSYKPLRHVVHQLRAQRKLGP